VWLARHKRTGDRAALKVVYLSRPGLTYQQVWQTALGCTEQKARCRIPYCSKFLVEIALVERPPKRENILLVGRK
jgi:hypothetical protein